MSFTTERKGMNSEKPNNYSKKINLVTALKFGEIYIYIYIYIQGVPGGMDKTSGECSLC